MASRLANGLFLVEPTARVLHIPRRCRRPPVSFRERQAALNEIECSIAIQNEGFQNLVVGSSVTRDEVVKRAPSNWYLEAEEARNIGLIEAVL
jgi:hypothetical protein